MLIHQGGYAGLHLVKLVYISSRNRPRNDQWCTSVVNQDGVHLIHHSKVVLALYQVFSLSSHVVTEVVKAKLVVSAVDNVRSIGSLSCGRVGLVLVNAVDREAVKFKEGSVPFRVTLG